MRFTGLNLKTKALASLVMMTLAVTGAQAELIEDVTYGDAPRNQLDIYLPDGVENPPVLVFVHGGRWFRNDKTQITRLDRANRLNDAGIAVVAINYTFSSGGLWPTQLEDLRKAFDFVRANADDYGYDASKIAVWGQSSGAHMALWAGLDQATSEETALDALISWYAPSDLFQIAPDRLKDDIPVNERLSEEPTPESQLIGVPVPENQELANAASPYHFLKGLPEDTKLPATLLAHGTMDNIVSPLQTERLNALFETRDTGGMLEYRVVEGGGHGGDLFDPEVDVVIDFLHMAFEK